MKSPKGLLDCQLWRKCRKPKSERRRNVGAVKRIKGRLSGQEKSSGIDAGLGLTTGKSSAIADKMTDTTVVSATGAATKVATGGAGRQLLSANTQQLTFDKTRRMSHH